MAIEELEAQTALDRLTRMELIEVVDGKMQRTALPIITSNEIPSNAIRKFHKESLEKASNSLDDVPVALREISSMVMAIDPKQLPKAKEYLKKVKRRVSKLLETDNPSEVYLLGFQLFPFSMEVPNETNE